MIKLRYNLFWTHDNFLGTPTAEKHQANSSKKLSPKTFLLREISVELRIKHFEASGNKFKITKDSKKMPTFCRSSYPDCTFLQEP